MLRMIPPSWPFTVWGLDILGQFPRIVRGYRYLYVTIDKFTKWPKETLVVKINKQSAVKFIKSILCRFRVLNRIITNNGSQFTSGAFQEYCEDLASRFAMHLLLTQRAIDKSKEPMQKSLRVSRPTPMMAWRNKARSGLMNFGAHYGVTGHLPAGQPERHLSSWCTGLRPSPPPPQVTMGSLCV
jgi:hypothetical protein